MGFKFEDITDEFLSRVVFYEFQHPNGLGNTEGSITMIAEDGQEYFIAGEGFELDYRDWGEAFSVFDEAGACGPDGRLGDSSGGEWRVYQVPFGFVVIRGELAGEFTSRGGYDGDGDDDGDGSLSPSAIAAEAMGLDADECHENRNVYGKTLEHWARERRRRALEQAQNERVALGPDDVEWHAIPRHGAEYADPAGCFAALHRRNDDGTFFTSLWSIEYQLDTDMATTPESRAGLYNLYYEKWAHAPAPAACEIVGEEVYVTHQREHGRRAGGAGDACEPRREIVDGRHFIESGARFVRSFPTLQAAKEGAMRRCACGLGWGGHTRENLVDGEGAFVFDVPEREDYAYDLGERPHPVICGKAAESWLVRMRDEETGEIVELMWDHATLSSVVCEVPMSSEVPTFASLLSIDPIPVGR